MRTALVTGASSEIARAMGSRSPLRGFLDVRRGPDRWRDAYTGHPD
jgi:NAD(P)-dependent dehydrogenase (short-subunit alcohol dehydrogenase family)